MDHGPWEVTWAVQHEGEPPVATGVQSRSAHYETTLRLTGHFASPAERVRYCEWLVTVLTKASEVFTAGDARRHPQTD